MDKEKVYKIVEACCDAQLSKEEEELYDYVKEAVVQWLYGKYDVEAQTEDFNGEELSSQVRYFIREFNEAEGKVKSIKEWEELEEAYRIIREGLDPNDSKFAKEWNGLKPDAIMFFAMEKYATKLVRGMNTFKGNEEFVEDVVMAAIGAAGVYNPEKIENKETIYDKAVNKKAFCGYFRGICTKQYLRAVKKELKEQHESYEIFLEKGIEVGETEIETEAEGGGALFAPKADRWMKELQELLRLVLQQVAKGPLNDHDGTPEVYRNLGGAFAKYVPFLEEDFVEKNGRFEIKTQRDDVPEEEIRSPRAEAGAQQASVQMFPIIENHVARSAAVMFAEIVNGTLTSYKNQFNWSKDFYNRILAYEKFHRRVKYRDVISSPKTMENHANAIHEFSLKKCKEILEKRLREEDPGITTEDLFLDIVKRELGEIEEKKETEREKRRERDRKRKEKKVEL